MWSLVFRLIAAALRGGRTATVTVARYGRIRFVGLIGNRPLQSLTQQEIRNALAKAGMREAHNAHFVSRLVSRGPQVGIRTLNDFARAFNNGVARPGRAGTIEVILSGNRGTVIISRSRGEFITFLH